MAYIISVVDLPSSVQSNELVDSMVDGANAKAARVAPCLVATGDNAPTQDQLAEAKLVLIGAVKRWVDAGSGAFEQQAAGPFSVTTDTRQRSGYNLWPSEIESLQDICRKDDDDSGAFDLDTVPPISAHLPWCALAFNANYCSCGTDIAGSPIFELE